MTNRLNKKRQYSKGVSLIEVLAGILVLSIALVAISNAVIRALQAADYARKKTKATKLTTETIEWVRSEKESMSWSDFAGRTGTWCLNNKTWEADPCTTYLNGFKSDLSINTYASCDSDTPDADGDAIKSILVVTWEGSDKKVRTVNCFTKWALEVTPEP